jgi:hypothetical protein
LWWDEVLIKTVCIGLINCKKFTNIFLIVKKEIRKGRSAINSKGENNN